MIKKDFEIDRESRLYPELLRQIPNPPKKLFCRGNPELLECRKVAVVGSRRYSLYGKQTALMIGKYFGKTELAVVSGLASGIDTFAHTGVLEAGAEAAAEDAVLLAAVLLLQAVMPRAAAPSALTAVPLRKDLRDSFDMVVSPYIFFSLRALRRNASLLKKKHSLRFYFNIDTVGCTLYS